MSDFNRSAAEACESKDEPQERLTTANNDSSAKALSEVNARPGAVADSSAAQSKFGNAPASEVTIGQGQNLWKATGQKYNGNYPLEAVYQANGMTPKATKANGQLELSDPRYDAGTYKMPAASDVRNLTGEYRKGVEAAGGYGRERVGQANEDTRVKLIYGDSFDKLAKAKYGHRIPVEAIYEANGLKGSIVDKNGKPSHREPIYFSGKNYLMPAESQVAELAKKYWTNLGHPEMCPKNLNGEWKATHQATKNREAGCATLPTEQRADRPAPVRTVVKERPVVVQQERNHGADLAGAAMIGSAVIPMIAGLFGNRNHGHHHHHHGHHRGYGYDGYNGGYGYNGYNNYNNFNNFNVNRQGMQLFRPPVVQQYYGPQQSYYAPQQYTWNQQQPHHHHHHHNRHRIF